MIPPAEYIDTHCHLDFPEFEADRDAVIARAAQAGVRRIVNVGSSLKGSEDSARLAARYAGVYASVGIHPHDARSCDSSTLLRLGELAREPKVVAVGEIGLDYYRMVSTRAEQREAFESQLELAGRAGLPVVVHCRQAQEDILSILQERRPAAAVIHCFSGDEAFLEGCLQLGCLVSFTANITYPKAQGVREVVSRVPLDRLMLETDAPFLSPEGKRGRRNEPESVVRVAEEVAALKRIPSDEAARLTTENAVRFFRL